MTTKIKMETTKDKQEQLTFYDIERDIGEALEKHKPFLEWVLNTQLGWSPKNGKPNIFHLTDLLRTIPMADLISYRIEWLEIQGKLDKPAVELTNG